MADPGSSSKEPAAAPKSERARSLHYRRRNAHSIIRDILGDEHDSLVEEFDRLVQAAEDYESLLVESSSDGATINGTTQDGQPPAEQTSSYTKPTTQTGQTGEEARPETHQAPPVSPQAPPATSPSTSQTPPATGPFVPSFVSSEQDQMSAMRRMRTRLQAQNPPRTNPFTTQAPPATTQLPGTTPAPATTAVPATNPSTAQAPPPVTSPSISPFVGSEQDQLVAFQQMRARLTNPNPPGTNPPAAQTPPATDPFPPTNIFTVQVPPVTNPFMSSFVSSEKDQTDALLQMRTRPTNPNPPRPAAPSTPPKSPPKSPKVTPHDKLKPVQQQDVPRESVKSPNARQVRRRGDTILVPWGAVKWIPVKLPKAPPPPPKIVPHSKYQKDTVVTVNGLPEIPEDRSMLLGMSYTVNVKYRPKKDVGGLFFKQKASPEHDDPPEMDRSDLLGLGYSNRSQSQTTAKPDPLIEKDALFQGGRTGLLGMSYGSNKTVKPQENMLSGKATPPPSENDGPSNSKRQKQVVRVGDTTATSSSKAPEPKPVEAAKGPENASLTSSRKIKPFKFAPNIKAPEFTTTSPSKFAFAVIKPAVPEPSNVGNKLFEFTPEELAKFGITQEYPKPFFPQHLLPKFTGFSAPAGTSSPDAALARPSKAASDATSSSPAPPGETPRLDKSKGQEPAGLKADEKAKREEAIRFAVATGDHPPLFDFSTWPADHPHAHDAPIFGFTPPGTASTSKDGPATDKKPKDNNTEQVPSVLDKEPLNTSPSGAPIFDLSKPVEGGNGALFNFNAKPPSTSSNGIPKFDFGGKSAVPKTPEPKSSEGTKVDLGSNPTDSQLPDNKTPENKTIQSGNGLKFEFNTKPSGTSPNGIPKFDFSGKAAVPKTPESKSNEGITVDSGSTAKSLQPSDSKAPENKSENVLTTTEITEIAGTKSSESKASEPRPDSPTRPPFQTPSTEAKSPSTQTQNTEASKSGASIAVESEPTETKTADSQVPKGDLDLTFTFPSTE